ncbi:MAG TPA: phage portal protein [Jiangellaceae bacterium]
MGILRRAWQWLNTTPTATFSETPRPIDVVIGEMMGHGVTPRVTRSEALTVPAVQRGRNMIASISTLPLVQVGPNRQVVRNPLLEQFDGDVANVVHLAQTIEDLLFEGIAWWRIVGFAFDGFPSRVRRVDPSQVSMQPPGGRQPAPLPGGHDPRGAVVWVDGEQVSVTEMIRFDSPNPGVLKVGGRAIKRAILLDQAARMYADDPRPLDYFTPAEGADPVDDDEVREILSEWRTARKERGTAYVPAALTYNAVDAPTPADLQLVELQRQAALEIANALGIDPEDVGVSTTSRTYANAVDRRRDRINDVLSPYMRALTDRLSMGDITKRGYRVIFDLDDYMRADPKTRWEVYAQAIGLGVMTADEVRQEEGLPGSAPRPSEPSRSNVKPDAASNATAPRPATRSQNADTEAMVTFAEPAGLQFADLPVTAFSVDREKRVIEGLALPYGKVGAKGGLKFRFAKGALRWTDPGRVKLLRDHNFKAPLGKAVQLTDAHEGLRVRFRVARGQAGDEALELAEDGVLDGLSVGVDFDLAADTSPDPADRTVTLVHRADLREVSLTPMPTFDDARVSRVAASRTEGDDPGMPEQTEAQPQTPPPASGGITLSADQFATMLDRFAPTAVAEPETREVVNPVRLSASATVTDPVPYRFDRQGNILPGAHEFSTDLFAAGRGDQAANERVMQFVHAQFDVATTDVNELNPTRNRPDLYVDQRSFRYPIWEAINKGTLSDITPFTFPKFSSAGSLVAAHTEGNEPSSGTLVTTSQTVTPTAISGKAKITRETWDQGGNPQVSNLIWRQMVKGWFEALEAAAVAVLDAASPTQIDFSGTPGLANEDLDQAITAAFAALQFIRGGFSMDHLFTQIDLYKALIAATDANGRRLYPALGPNNAMGTVRSRFAALDINGVTALPAWALAATGTVAASSYLFDSESVHGWASAPQRLDFNIEVAHVYIGIWGYKATAISDINGVREIVYDPS